MMKKRSLFAALIVFAGCGEAVVDGSMAQTLGACYEIHSTFNIHKVDCTYSSNKIEMLLTDLAYSDMPNEEMKGLSVRIDSHICKEYQYFDTIPSIEYIFQSLGGYKVVSFTIDTTRSVVDTKVF